MSNQQHLMHARKTGVKSGRRVNDPLRAIGVRDWAAALQADTFDVVAVAAFILRGVAGPEACFQNLWGASLLAKLDLVSDSRDLKVKRVSQALSDPLRRLDQGLVQAALLRSEDAFDYCVAGPFARNARRMPAEGAQRVIQRHWAELTREDASLEGDLKSRGVALRMEAMRHSSVIVERADGRDLGRFVDFCHLRSALVLWPDLGLGRGGGEPVTVARQLADLMEGSILGIRDPRSNAVARAHVLLAVNPAEAHVLARGAPELPGHLLRIGAAKESATTMPDPARAADCAKRFEQAIWRLLEMRRSDRAPLARPRDPDCLMAFESARWSYRNETAEISPDPVLQELPEVLFAALLWISGDLDWKGAPTEADLADCAISAATALRGRHVRAVGEQESAVHHSEFARLAKRIVEVINAKGPVTRRQLVRHFKQQRSDRFEPVISWLVGESVIAECADGKLDAGREPLERALEGLFGKAGE